MAVLLRLGMFLMVFLIWQNMMAADILFLNQDCNNDTFGPDATCADERYNVLNQITAQGHNVTMLDSLNHPDLSTLLAAHDFLLIPELEEVSCSVAQPTFINTAASATLKLYVENGGRILTMGGERNVNLINALFSLSLGTPINTTSGTATLNNTYATGTIFENCPMEIPNISVTFLLTSTMPASKLCIYESGGNASVALFPIGTGYVVYLGYEFFDAGPGCTQDASVWTGCLIESAVAAATFGPSGVPPAPIPTLSQWGLILLSISLSILGVLGLKQRVLAI